MAYEPLQGNALCQSALELDRQASLKAWLGDSNLVDAQGNPLLLFHGTRSKEPIEQFIPGGLYDSRLTGDAYGVGTYLTTSAHEASTYAGAEGAVYAVYARGEMLILPLDMSLLLPERQSKLLTAFAQEHMVDCDKARFGATRAHRDFTSDKEASALFDEQRQRWEIRGFGYDSSFPEVTEAPQGGFRVEFTDWDAPVQIVTSGDAWQLLKAVGFDSLSNMGLDGLMLERSDNQYWAVCHKSAAQNIKSAHSASFDAGNPYLANRSNQALQAEIEAICHDRQIAVSLPYRDALQKHLEALEPEEVLESAAQLLIDTRNWSRADALERVHTLFADADLSAASAQLLVSLGGKWAPKDTSMALTVFHGSETVFSQMEKSASGTLGSGFYFADSADSAGNYGTHVLTGTVHFKNPWVVTLEYDSPMSEALELDSPALEAVSTLPNGATLIEQCKLNDFAHFGADLQRQLEAMGHDGIVATYVDGSMEIVPFEASQVQGLKPLVASDLSLQPSSEQIRIPSESSHSPEISR